MDRIETIAAQTPVPAEWWIVAALAVVALLLAWPLARRGGRQRRRHRVRGVSAPAPTPLRAMADPTRQIAAVEAVTFERLRLLNKGEYRALLALERIVAEMGDGHRVMAQTSLGELIAPAGPRDRTARDAFAAVNSKRLDFAVIDRRGYLVAAVEVQGGGHWQGNAVLRDAVKREALRRAGIEMVELAPDAPSGEIAARLRIALARMAA